MVTGEKVACGLLTRLLALRDAETGVWTGELASSALGTALASVALLEDGGPSGRDLAAAGAAWLDANANPDGGWGDTSASGSNLSTTLIVSAALRRIGRRDGNFSETLSRAEAWICAKAGGSEPETIARALGRIYGKDRTFAAPILTFLAVCGDDARAWWSVPPLPFLLALLPRGLYRFLRLQVVSYALPALIAVGLCRHVGAAAARGRRPWGRLFAGPLLGRLSALQPVHGGFLDAIPLTAFVCLALRRAGYGGCPVVTKGLRFLRGAARPDGSWAIDSNLRTWVTTLAVRATVRKGGASLLGTEDLERIAAWIVGAQMKTRHPFTGARPGGWAWTDLPGGVPDADDTSGALVALKRLKEAGVAADVSGAVRGGVNWLLDLQNPDGGMPTFCRGWGQLPFDRSCPDISAHALSALEAWRGSGVLTPRERWLVGRAMCRLIGYLASSRLRDGSWTPLWFGHQEAAEGRNPAVGTARVVEALCAVRDAVDEKERGRVETLAAGGAAWLLAAQRPDGGWGMGTDATTEETALAVCALSGCGPGCAKAVARGRGWLVARGAEGLERAAPIGLYFALLWYHERLYPLVWALEALGRSAEKERYCHDGTGD